MEFAEVMYKTTDSCAPEHKRAVAWCDDPNLAIEWPLDAEPTRSAKDAGAPRSQDAEVHR